MIRWIPRYLYNALQIQPQKLVQITSNSYAAELQKKIRLYMFNVSAQAASNSPEVEVMPAACLCRTCRWSPRCLRP